MRAIQTAFRRLCFAPAAAGGMLLSLSISVAATTTVFSWIDTILLNPFPAIQDSGQLSVVAGRARAGTLEPLSPPALQQVRNSATSFDRFAFSAVTLNALNLTNRATNSDSRVFAHFVSSNYFDTLDVPMQHGPSFEIHNDLADSEEPVAVISDRLWATAFGKTSNLDGLRIDLNGRPTRIVGVTHPDFAGTVVGLSVDMWVPISMRRALMPGAAAANDRESRWVIGLAAARDGAVAGDIEAQLASASDELRRAFPVTDDRFIASIPIWQSPWGAQGGTGPVLWLFAGLVLLLLLMSCANAANLVLVRALARQRDFAIRVAIGASRAAIVREHLAEGAILAAITTLVSVIAVHLLANLLLAFVPPTDTPFSLATGLSWRVAAFAATLSLSAVAIVMTLPVLRLSRMINVQALRGGDGSSRAGRRVKESLVVAQIALSVAILAVGGLFFRSLQESRSMPTGFARDGVWLVGYDLAQLGYSAGDGMAIHERLRREVGSLPSVSAASSALRVPLGFTPLPSESISVPGYAAQVGEDLSVGTNRVGPGYFATMGIPLLRGREFADSDAMDREPVVIVNEAMAQRFWGSRDPLNDIVQIGGRAARVVGIAATGKYRTLSEPPTPHAYLAITQAYAPRVTLHVRATTTSEALSVDLRRLASTVDRSLTLSSAQSMTEHLQFATMIARVSSSFLGMFGGLAVLVAALGLTTVLVSVFTGRQRELAIRQACGATPLSIKQLIATYAMRLTGFGLLPGVVLAGVSGRAANALLVGVSPWDVWAYSIVVGVVSLLSLLAALVPIVMVSRMSLSRTLKDA